MTASERRDTVQVMAIRGISQRKALHYLGPIGFPGQRSGSP